MSTPVHDEPEVRAAGAPTRTTTDQQSPPTPERDDHLVRGYN